MVAASQSISGRTKAYPISVWTDSHSERTRTSARVRTRAGVTLRIAYLMT